MSVVRVVRHFHSTRADPCVLACPVEGIAAAALHVVAPRRAVDDDVAVRALARVLGAEGSATRHRALD